MGGSPVLEHWANFRSRPRLEHRSQACPRSGMSSIWPVLARFCDTRLVRAPFVRTPFVLPGVLPGGLARSVAAGLSSAGVWLVGYLATRSAGRRAEAGGKWANTGFLIPLIEPS